MAADEATPIDRTGRARRRAVRLLRRFPDEAAPRQPAFDALTDLGAALEEWLRRLVLRRK